MQASLHDARILDLARLDALDVSLEGHVHPNWGFVDEVFFACQSHGWAPRMAAWAVLASRARRAGLREALDIDGLVEALARHMPVAMRVATARAPALGPARGA